MNFFPAVTVSAELTAEVASWNDKLALLRGDNIYDVSRLYFSAKGINAAQNNLTADIEHGSSLVQNTVVVFDKVINEILEPNGLRFIRTLMGRMICNETAIIGVLVNPTGSATKAKYDVIGTELFVEWFSKKFEEIITSVEVPYLRRLSLDGQGCLTSSIETLPSLTKVPNIAAFYPYFTRTPEQVMKEFLASSSNILVLIGEPGTGKSNFILQMLQARGWDDKINMADREDVLLNPGLSDYIRNCPEGSIMVTEDSDKLVMKRTNGNENMSAVLNATAGIVTNDRKLIISTNLESLSSVDSALLRPGRCFDVLRFEKITKEQAYAVRDMMQYSDVEIVEEYLTLAEALNYHEVHRDRVVQQKAFGFANK